MPLSDKAIRSLKPRKKPYRVTDGQGLCLRVSPKGALSWQVLFRWNRKRQILSLGPYPEVSIKRAREKLLAARVMLADGRDPREVMCRRWQRAKTGETLQQVFEEWITLQQASLAQITIDKARWLVAPVLADLGSRPIASITAADLLASLKKIEAQGKRESAHRAKQRVGQVFRYAIAHGKAQHDITANLRGALAPVVTTSHAALTDPVKVGELLRAIDGYQGQPSVQAALRLSPLVFLRSRELRGADWSELQLEGAAPEWRVPGERMKMGRLHIVPLSKQAVAILRELYALTGPSGLVFPGLRSRHRPISSNTLNAALRRLGYANTDQVQHGFRTTASTLLHEQGFNSDWIEMQLAHWPDGVRGVYNHALYLPGRREMMQAWADYLDTLKKLPDPPSKKALSNQRLAEAGLP